MNKLIKNGTVVNEGVAFVGDILIKDDRIAEIICHSDAKNSGNPEVRESGNPRTREPENTQNLEVIDATGCYVLPGIIDTHVHFREPGLTHKADIESESRAAAYGGVTSYFDMPNCIPQTTTLEALKEKQAIAAEKSHVNYAFFFGATTENTHLFKELDRETVPGVKLFMGSSTGNMLVDGEDALAKVFKTAAEEDLIVMAHCEDNGVIQKQTDKIKQTYGEDADISLHPVIRNREACKLSTLKAMLLAREYKTRLHVAHISTKGEAEVFTSAASVLERPITFEVCLPHILFSFEDYATRGARIKCNPAVKTEEDRQAIIQAIREGKIATIATDHAPHTIEEKQGGCLKATSGMPMLQFSLVAMLEAMEKAECEVQSTEYRKQHAVETAIRLMSHAPAQLFGIKERGFIRKGYKADLVIVQRNNEPWTLTKAEIQSKCGWSPLEGDKFHWQVLHTFCNGNHILNKNLFNPESRGEQITFQV